MEVVLHSLVDVYIVVVTYNRKILLELCLNKTVIQSYNFKKILIVNNDSTDGTEEYIKSTGLLKNERIKWINLAQNMGGAGGFSVGMKYAFDDGADFVWMMDDDAMPHTTALEELMKYATSNHIYSSLAINGQNSSWTTYLIDEKKSVNCINEIPNISEVKSLPFLGFLTSKEIYKQIGLPDSKYFILVDDTEYCMRAQKLGFKTFICGRSYIDHPKALYQEYKFFGKRINYVSLPPWKRYYDTRNRIFLAKKYFGFRLYYQTLPSLIIRCLISLANQPNKFQQMKAYFWGVYDGIFSNGGKLHEERGLL